MHRRQEQLLEAPIATMDSEGLRKALARDVMCQSTATDYVALHAMIAWRHHKHQPKQRYIDCMQLSGPSGNGKTLTVQRLRHYMGMDEGYRYKHCEVYVQSCDGSVYSMVDCLVAAVQSKTPPPVILLHVEDTNCAHRDVLPLVTSLLEHGELKGADNGHFRLPVETALLCVFTSCYGELPHLTPLHSHEYAQHAIKADMKAHGIASRHMERMGTIVPYRPLEPKQMKGVLAVKLDEFLAQRMIEASKETRRILVQQTLDLVEPRRSVRHTKEKLLWGIQKLIQEIPIDEQDGLCVTVQVHVDKIGAEERQ